MHGSDADRRSEIINLRSNIKLGDTRDYTQVRYRRHAEMRTSLSTTSVSNLINAST